MMPCRGLSLVALSWLLLSPTTQAREYLLRERLSKDDCHAVHLDMSLRGDLHFTHEGKRQSVPLEASASHTWSERILMVEEGRLPRKAARFYREAKSTVKVRKAVTKKELRPECRLMVVQEMTQGLVSWCPNAQLYRSEVELTEHLSSLHLTGLLPGTSVEVNESWSILPQVVQTLCQFDGLIDQKWKCTLRSVQDDQANVTFRGRARGVEDGALVEVEVTGGYRFDLKKKQMVWMRWEQSDRREGGPVSPNLIAKVSVTLTRTKIDVPVELNETVLKAVPEDLTVPEGKDLLQHEDAKGRYRFSFDRGWHVVSLNERHLVLRLIRQGEMMAQVIVTPWSKVSPPLNHVSPEDFRKAIHSAENWKPTKAISQGTLQHPKKYWAHLLSEKGLLDGLDVIRRTYLVADEKGRQYALSFAMVPKHAETFGKRDVDLIRSFEILK